MANQPVNRIHMRDMDDGVPPPPRALLWFVVAFFLLIVIAAIGAIIVLQSRPSPSELLGLAVQIAPLTTLLTIIAAVVFRKKLPRRFPVWLTLGWAVLWVVGGIAFIIIFRTVLPPGQRETVKSYLPFMEIFAPPLPSIGTSLPTPIPNQESDVTVEDLLSAPLGVAPVQTAAPTPEQAVITEATAEPTATSTPLPTATVSIEPTVVEPISVPTEVSIVPTALPSNNNLPAVPLSAQLFGITHVKQGWNNCGPANITMALSYYGWRQNEDFAVRALKPDREDKNVNPWELVNFVNEQSQVRALTRIGGDMTLLKRFISSKFPVLIETGYMYEGSDWLGHYQTVVGYDDTQGVFFVYDSYLGTGENGTGLPKTYAEFDEFWENFNRTFIVLYKPEEENLVRTILGDRADVIKAAEIAAQVAQDEARANPQNGFAWFNLGSSLTRLGQFEQAAAAFDRARQVGTHWRMTLYQFGIFEAYFEVGRYDDIMGIVDANMLNGGQYIEETHYWKGKVLAVRGDTAGAAAAFRQALARNPFFTAASEALNAL